jgi:hypothetical protein
VLKPHTRSKHVHRTAAVLCKPLEDASKLEAETPAAHLSAGGFSSMPSPEYVNFKQQQSGHQDNPEQLRISSPRETALHTSSLIPCCGNAWGLSSIPRVG